MDLIRRFPLLNTELFDPFFGNSTLMDDRHFGPEGFAVDITETDDSVILKAELPGVKKEDISVDVQDGILLLKAEKKEESEEKGETFLRKETYYGSMQRSFNVGEIDVDSITATYKDGILNVNLKKKAEEAKKIEIQ